MPRVNIVQSEVRYFPSILLVKSACYRLDVILSSVHFVSAVKFNVKTEKQPEFLFISLGLVLF